MPSPSPGREAVELIGSRLKEARARSGLTRQAAADQAGVPSRSLRGWENGEVTQPAWVIPKLAAVYGTAVEHLLAPDRSFLALVDTAAEKEALAESNAQRFDELAQRVSVFVTEHVVPMTSTEEWVDRMVRLKQHGAALREVGDEQRDGS